MKNDFLIQSFGERIICLKGVGKMFYQEGFPISMAISELRNKNIEVSFLHMIEEFWENEWSWKTIEMKLRGEMEIDIDKSINVDMDELQYFYSLLEQPRRKNGGYEESRELIFKYLFSDVNPEKWFKSKTNLWSTNFI
jgi:hypothetical protein